MPIEISDEVGITKKTEQAPPTIQKTEVSTSIEQTAFSVETATKEFTPNPNDNSKAKMRMEEIGGTVNGIFAKESINIGELIATFEGPILTADKISDLPSVYLQDHVLQVGETQYLMNKSGIAHYLNHSCDPNCGIVDGVKIVALRDIEPGEALTWDYESTEDSDWEMPFKCACRSENCRGKIRAFRYMPYQQRQKLKGFIAPWILEKYKDWVEFENLTANEITPKHIQELTDLIRRVFSNDWAEYAYCPKCDPEVPHGKKLSVRNVFDVGESTYVPLVQLNDQSKLPKCDDCGTQMQLFMDPEASFKTLESKLKKDAWLSLMRNVEGEVVGATYSYMRPLYEVFKKEWENYYSYADPQTSPDKKRDWKNFYEKISAAMKENQEKNPDAPQQEISEDMDTICSNLIVVSREYRNKGHFFNLSTQTFMIDGALDHMHKFGLCESVRNTKAHKLFLRGGSVEVPGILQDESVELKEDDYVMLLFKISKFFESFFRG